MGLKIPHDELWEILKQWNSRNSPPLDESELRRSFDSIAKREASKQELQIHVIDLLDTTQKVLVDSQQNYNRIPFAADQLNFLQAKMAGGLVGGRLYVIGGIPSAGKTALANDIADNFCLSGNPVLFFSYDDGRSELRNRTFARFSNRRIEDFNRNSVSSEDLKVILQDISLKQIQTLKYVVEKSISIEKWESLVQQIRNRHSKSPVIMIDYLRKLKTDEGRSDERLRVDDILSKLTDLAKSHNLPVFCISELARDSYKSGQRLSMASFKESGTIEYEASWLGILAVVEERDGQYVIKENWENIIEQDGNIDLMIFKAKRGTGQTGRVPLNINKDKMTVRDREQSSRYDTVTPVRKSKHFG